jgi:PilZ domain
MPDQPAERREAPRYSVNMDAQTTDLVTRSVIKQRCSDISLSGCYLDTLNPIDPGTPLWVRIDHGERSFTVQARVAYMVPRLGMGLEFAQPIPEDQLAVLKEWIEEVVALSKPLSSPFGMSVPR